ncbi:hypothetical protein ACLQ29_31840 [Micromonospora sp. DT228]|uniref:hypothetical protein n=1 Tax=Micromonospora sp. DT228 TaxID=3393443 RepID=UPI003CED69BE
MVAKLPRKILLLSLKRAGQQHRHREPLLETLGRSHYQPTAQLCQVNYSTYPAAQRYTSSAATTPVNVALTASVITTPVAIPTVVYTPPPCAATGWGVR